MGRVQLTPWGRLASVRGPSSAPARPPSPDPLSIKCCEVAMQIALVLYPKFTVLDIIGPFQALVDVPGHDVVFVGAEAGPVIDHTGRCPLVASASFAEVPSPDVVVVPGGKSKDFTGPVASWLRACIRQRPGSRASVRGQSFWPPPDSSTVWTDHTLGVDRTSREVRRSVHRGACGRAGKDHHISGRVERNRYGAHTAQSHRRPGSGPGR